MDLVINGCSTSDREDVKPQIRKEDGIIFEDLLERWNCTRCLDIDRRHLEEYMRKRLKVGDG